MQSDDKITNMQLMQYSKSHLTYKKINATLHVFINECKLVQYCTQCETN